MSLAVYVSARRTRPSACSRGPLGQGSLGARRPAETCQPAPLPRAAGCASSPCTRPGPGPQPLEHAPADVGIELGQRVVQQQHRAVPVPPSDRRAPRRGGAPAPEAAARRARPNVRASARPSSHRRGRRGAGRPASARAGDLLAGPRPARRAAPAAWPSRSAAGPTEARSSSVTPATSGPSASWTSRTAPPASASASPAAVAGSRMPSAASCSSQGARSRAPSGRPARSAGGECAAGAPVGIARGTPRHGPA